MPTSAFSIHPAAFALGMISNGMTIFSVLHLFLIPALLAALAAENCHYKLAASPPIPSEATTFHFWGPSGQHNIRARRRMEPQEDSGAGTYTFRGAFLIFLIN